MDSPLRSLCHDILNKLCIIRSGVESSIEEIKLLSISAKRKEKILYKLDKADSCILDISEYCNEVMEGPNDSKQVLIMKEIMEVLKNQFTTDQFKIEIQNLAPLSLNCSKSKIDRIISNIMKNSRDAGSSHLVIEIRKKSLIFRDNGGGISESIISDVTSGLSPNSSKDGHGIGLISIINCCEEQNWKFLIENSTLNAHGLSKGVAIRIEFS